MELAQFDETTDFAADAADAADLTSAQERSTQMNDDPSNPTSELTDQRIEETIAPFQEQLAMMNKSLKSLMDALEMSRRR